MLEDIGNIWANLSRVEKLLSAFAAGLTFVLAAWHQVLKIRKAQIEIKKEKESEKQSEHNAPLLKDLNYAEAPSNYDLCNETASEVYRLKFQADRIHDFDNVERPNVVDLGCADGYLTFSRFGDKEKWGKVFGLDKHASSIKEANSVQKEEFSFFEFDLVEHAKKSTDFKKWVDGTDVNIIFSALTIHHLGIPNQKRVINYLWDQLADPGALVVRTFDDGLKITCPEYSALAEELVEISATFPGAEDRYQGRRLYSQMMTACKGSCGVGSRYFIKDTIGMSASEKDKFFHYAYGFRMERVRRALELNPDNMNLRKIHARAKEVTDKLKQAFVNDRDFYSASSEMFIYAVKNNSSQTKP